MVQVVNLPSRLNMLAQSAGQGINQGLTEGVDMLLRKKGINNAFQGLNSPNASPVDVLKSLVQASVHSPEIGKNLGTIYSEYNKVKNTKNYGNAVKKSAASNISQSQDINAQDDVVPTLEVPDQAPQVDDQRQKDTTLLNSKSGENLGSAVGAPLTWNHLLSPKITKQKEAEIREQFADQPPEVVERLVNLENENTAANYQKEHTNLSVDAARQAFLDKKRREISSRADSALPQLLPEFQNNPEIMHEFRNKYDQFVNEQSVDKSPEQTHQDAYQKLLPIKKLVSDFKVSPAAPPLRNSSGYESWFKDVKPTISELAKNGMFETAEKLLVDKGAGITDLHRLLYGDQTSLENVKRMDQIEPAKRTVQVGPGFTGGSFAESMTEKNVERLANNLMKISPRDDLILLREPIINKHYGYKDFNKALDLAIKKGLKLSDFQKGQIAKLNIAPMPPLQSFWSDPVFYFQTAFKNLRGHK